MHLWTEYEGRTVAGAYTLGKLLRSEGRNGFFSTADKKGQQAVIRLTESHYDEDELIERWRHVAGIQQDHLIGIDRVGKTNFEDVALTFALMEPDDANLGDVVKERPLTTQEALQVARAVSSALLALHRSGLVHEHIEPVNVMAVGETVKLRSDCVRECVADKEFNTPEGCAILRRKDIRDFATLLLQCLTLEKEFRPSSQLPAPFQRIIPGALDGTLSLEQIDAVLNPPAPATATVTPALAATAAATQGIPNPEVPSTEALPAAEQADLSQKLAQPPLHFRPRNERLSTSRTQLAGKLPLKRWGIYAATALVVLLGIWLLTRGNSERPQAAASPVVTSAPAGVSAVAPVAAMKTSPAKGAASSITAGWYVVAYTYNHPEQARTKAARLSRKHAALNPQVFSPSGHAPFYVTLGGAMSQEEASNLVRIGRRSGMPRDTFIRNF